MIGDENSTSENGCNRGDGGSNDGNSKKEQESLGTNTNAETETSITVENSKMSTRESSGRDLNNKNENVASDLVWDDEEEDYQNNDDDLSYDGEYDEDGDDDDDLSFKSAKTSYTNYSSSNNNNGGSNGAMYSSSLEESFITYAHDSIISLTIPTPLQQKQKLKQKQKQKQKRLPPSLVPPHLTVGSSSMSFEKQQQTIRSKLSESSLGEVIIEEEIGMGGQERQQRGGEPSAARAGTGLTESFDEISYDSSSACSSSSSFVDALSEDEEYDEDYNNETKHEEEVEKNKMSNSTSTEIIANNNVDENNNNMDNTSSGTCTEQADSTNTTTTTNNDNVLKQQKQSTSNSATSNRNRNVQTISTKTNNTVKPTQTTKTTKTRHQHYQRQRPKIHSFTFNQDKNCIVIATSTGYRIRTLPLSTFAPLEQHSCDNRSDHDNDNKQQQAAPGGGSFSNHVKIHQVIYPPAVVSRSSPSNSSFNNNSSSSSINSNGSSKNTINNNNSGVSHIQIIHSTSVLFIVKKQTPRLLSIVHAKTAQVILDIPFTNAIRRIEANIASLVVLTADGLLHVFSLKGGSGSNGGGGDKQAELQNKQEKKGIQFIKTIEILHSTESTRMMTAENAKTQGAFFDLSSHLFTTAAVDTSREKAKVKMGSNDCTSGGGDSWLVTKSNERVGYVSVYKTSTKVIFVTKEHKGPKGANTNASPKRKPVIQKKKKDCMELIETFQAHDHGIARITIGGATDVHLKQKVFATVSLKGTVIRVFNLPSCSKLYEFHRGTSPCTMFSLSFNFDASMIASSSSRGTVHVFQLTEETRIQEPSMSSYDYDSNSAEGMQSPSTKQRWYDNILSSIKKTKNDDDSNFQIVRSIAKIKCEKPVVPNTIAILPNKRSERTGVDTGDENDDNEYVAICFENGKLLVYAVRKKPSRMVRPRPVLADDIMFDSESALAS